MKRVFDDADRAKKQARVPSRSTAGTPTKVNEAIRASLKEGFLPCETAFEIAKKLRVSPVAVGDAADNLGIRVTDCRLGCFSVEKTAHDGAKTIRPEIIRAVTAEIAKSPLTCAGVFSLAKRLKVSPLEIADAANAAHVKIHHCQLGCF